MILVPKMLQLMLTGWRVTAVVSWLINSMDKKDTVGVLFLKTAKANMGHSEGDIL